MTTPDEAGADVHVPSAPDPSTITFIDFLLDETGSMTSCAGATRAGFDEFVASQRSEPGSCFLTLSKFDSVSIRTPYVNLPIASVPPLSFFPGQMTNLFDCIGERLTAAIEERRYGRSLFVVMTDGDDNRSRAFTLESARDLVVRAQDSGTTVVFLGPDESALSVGAALGIPPGNVRSFSTARMRETMNDLSVAVTAFRAGAPAAAFFS